MYKWKKAREGRWLFNTSAAQFSCTRWVQLSGASAYHGHNTQLIVRYLWKNTATLCSSPSEAGLATQVPAGNPWSPGGYQMEHKSQRDCTRAAMAANHIVFMESQWANQEKPLNLLLAPGGDMWNRVFHFGLQDREDRDGTEPPR